MKIARTAIALDVGGTRIKAGVFSESGAALFQTAFPTPSTASARDLRACLIDVAEAMVERYPKAVGIGLSLTGATDPERGVVNLPGKIQFLEGLNLVSSLKKRFGLPVIADNDGRLAALAEWKRGRGVGAENLVVFTLGTGIGSGVVSEGRLLGRGSFLRGTQVGHMVIDMNGVPCLTGPNGTGEATASVTALVNLVKDHMARGISSQLQQKEAAAIDFKAITEAVRRGDPLACRIFEIWLQRLSLVFLNAYYAYAPQLFVVSGGPSACGDLIFPKIQKALEAQAFRFPKKLKIPVLRGKFVHDASCVGAALLALGGNHES